MRAILGRKQSVSNSDWLKAVETIGELVSKEELDLLVDKTISEIKEKTDEKKVAYAWSGGKDSIVLGDICTKANINDSMIGICNLEYPKFIKWIQKNKPKDCQIINTGQDLEWLSKHLDMLFPKESSKAARWFSIVQHKAQSKYFIDNGLDMIILGRRKADGNYVGKNDNIYTSKNVTRYSPLSSWEHEFILAYIHYYKLSLPPIYKWHNGYKCGTHPWPARQYVENGWQEIFNIDKNIVHEAAELIPSAKEFLESEVAK